MHCKKARVAVMAKEILVDSQFTDEMLESGRILLKAIDGSGLKINNALWFFSSDIHTWRFILSSTQTDNLGPLASYEKIQKIIKKIPNDQLTPRLKDISIPNSKSHLITAIRAAIHTGSGVSGIRFSRSMINNLFIEDAFIYRLN